MPDTLLVGCDFSSRPSRKKPVVLALGSLHSGRVLLSKLEQLESLEAFAQWLQQPRSGVGALICRSGCRVNWSSPWAGPHDVDVTTGQARRVAPEAYPGLLAREVLAKRSYKSDDKARQTPERLIARKDLITALEHGQTRLGLRLKLSPAQRDVLVDDASGDSLDAVLCLVQAAWAQSRQREGAARYGLPDDMDPLEGWIMTA